MAAPADARRGTALSAQAVQEAFVALSADAWRLQAPLTFVTVSALRAPGMALIDTAAAQLSFDLQDVNRVDSAGLALLIDWLARAAARSCRLSYARPPEALLSLARLSDVLRLIVP